MTKVTICVPTFNRANTLRHTIQAMLDQSFQDWELIVCDDSSTDDTEAVVRSFSDDRIIYHRNPSNLGLYGNWNSGIQLASGDYIAIYHDHDIYLPYILEASVALLEKYPHASFVHTAVMMIDEDNNAVAVDIRPFEELTDGTVLREVLANAWHSPVMAATALVRRDAYQQVGGYDYANYGYAADLDMWFRLAMIGDAAYVSTPCAFIRTRKKGDKTAEFRWSGLQGRIRMRDKHRSEMKLEQKPASQLKYVLQRDVMFLQYFVRAVLLESPENVAEGLQFLRQHASRWLYWLAKFINQSGLIRGLLHKHFLPLHYRKVNQNVLQMRERAIKYLDANLQLQDYLNNL